VSGVFVSLGCVRASVATERSGAVCSCLWRCRQGTRRPWSRWHRAQCGIECGRVAPLAPITAGRSPPVLGDFGIGRATMTGTGRAQGCALRVRYHCNQGLGARGRTLSGLSRPFSGTPDRALAQVH
jgi:hypothetical protein